MSEVRVFELAQELNMPAKDLLIKMRKAGIPVTSNFSELSSKQAEIVRKMGKSAKGIILPKSAKGSGKIRLRSTEKKPEGTDKVKESKTTKKSQIVTISTISKLDDEDVVAIPKRRVRKKKTEPVHSSEDSTVQVADKLKTDSEIDIISADATKVRPEQPVLESDLSKISTFESQETLSVSGDPASENKVEPDAETVDDSKHSKLTALDKNTDETVLPDGEKSGISENKSNKTKIIFKHSQTDDKESSSKNRGLGRPEFENKRKGGGGQIDYNYLREKRPRRRRKDFPKKRFDSKISRKVSDPNTPKHVFNPRKKSIRIGNQVGVAELAGLIGIKVPEILRKLMSLGIMVTINQTITGETAELIAADFDITIKVESFELSDLLREEELDVSELENRAPIVTIMGHVDHGKTSLLDKIRESRIASGEAGGITQHIGAYHLEVKGNQVTFLDTPGHEAFTSMRARGANITDIVVLVVASDDKVQPQTVEAIQHARAANVPIIVAVNKIDRPESDPLRIQQELLSHELIPEDLGGSTIFVKVSAKTGDGIDELLEMIHLQAEILELKSTSKGFAR